MSQQPNVIRRCVEIFRRRPRLYAAVAAVPYATLHPALLRVFWFLLVRPAGPGQDLRAIFDAMTFNDKLELIALFFLWVTVPFAVAGRGLCRVASEQIANREISFRDAIEKIGPFTALRRGLSRVGRVFGRVLLLFFGYGFFILATLILQGILLSAA